MSTLAQSPASDQMLSVATATGGKFKARVLKGGKTLWAGKFNSESSAWIAARQKSVEIRRMADRKDASPAKGIDRLLNAVTSTAPITTEIERGSKWDDLLSEFLGRIDADSIYTGLGATELQTGSGAMFLCAVPMTYLLPSGRVLVKTDGHKHGSCGSDVLRLFSAQADWAAERKERMGDRWDGQG